MKRPNVDNPHDACCRCGLLFPTPADHLNPREGELHVHQPEPSDPPQWICSSCKKELPA